MTKQFIIKQLRDLVIITLVGIAISIGFGADFTSKSFIYYVIYSALIGFSLLKGNQYLGYLLKRKISWKKNPAKSWIIHLLVLFLFSFVDIFTINYFWFAIQKASFNEVFDVAKWIFLSEIITTVVFAMFFYTIMFYKFWRLSIINEEKIKRQVLALQYDSLKNQVNPHFLFNSFNTLTSLIETDKNLAIKFLKQLSDVYRYVLNQKDNEIIDLKTEIEFVKSYVYLQKIRYNKNLKVNINLLDNDFSAQIVPLSIQMLVENAIKHNIISQEKPLIIDIYSKDAKFLIIKNNLQIKNMITTSNGVGLKNIQSRYEFLSDNKVEVIKDAFNFIVKLPIIK